MNKNEPAVVFYQVGCPFCEWSRQFIEKRDKRKRITFRDIETYPHVAGLRDARGNPTTIVLMVRGTSFVKYRACITIGTLLGGFLGAGAQIFRFVPNYIGDWAYDWVSKHRSSLLRLVKYWD